ncbi:hypothetical protein AGLY_003671 [Aphis glycines]|uniref:Uncharacterized protein n=1 Tax=Aphis glycines TaxID=307491 RepID=A0A6G0U175_APHGL|nr:hypothetical protein AGLY_003671 [Aphis glycines]
MLAIYTVHSIGIFNGQRSARGQLIIDILKHKIVRNYHQIVCYNPIIPIDLVHSCFEAVYLLYYLCKRSRVRLWTPQPMYRIHEFRFKIRFAIKVQFLSCIKENRYGRREEYHLRCADTAKIDNKESAEQVLFSDTLLDLVLIHCSFNVMLFLKLNNKQIISNIKFDKFGYSSLMPKSFNTLLTLKQLTVPQESLKQ